MAALDHAQLSDVHVSPTALSQAYGSRYEQEHLGAKLYYCHFPEPWVRNDMQWRTTVLCG